MSVSQLQAWAEDEANELIKKYDKNGDGVLTKDELQSFLHDVRGSNQLNNQGFISKIPEMNDGIMHKLSSNTHVQPKKRLQDKAQKFSAKVLDRKVSNMSLSQEQMKEIFKHHDNNKDGFLSTRELTKAFGFLGSILPFYKAHYGLAYADADNDGLISEAELDKLVDYASKVMKKK